MERKTTTFKESEPKWSKFFSRIQWIVSSFVEQKKAFNSEIGWYGMVWWFAIYLRNSKLASRMLQCVIKSTDSYFETHYPDIIDKYVNFDAEKNHSEMLTNKDYPIWCFWWQGEDKMPFIAKSCFERIKRNNDNVVLITQKNIHQYVDIPNVIFERVNEGKISFTHLSDILRLTLLADHGGMWVDVTCFNPYPIPAVAKEMEFYSPHDVQKQKTLRNVSYLCDLGGWRSWNLGTRRKNGLLFSFCRDLIQRIAIDSGCMPNYFMVDLMISYAYRKFPAVKDMIDAMPDINTRCADLFLLYFNPNRIWDEDEYKKLIEKDWMFKLTYKTVWLEKVNGKDTFYGKLFGHNPESI
jgi:hypothetical protein